MVDKAISNAWRLHDQWIQLQFRLSTANFYLKQSSKKHSARPSSLNIEGLHLDGADHVPEKLPQRVRCVICHDRNRWICKKRK